MTRIAEKVMVYRVGLVTCSACCDADVPIEEVELIVNGRYPTGITSPWRVSTAAVFATGQPHPCPCEQDPARVHRLLAC